MSYNIVQNQPSWVGGGTLTNFMLSATESVGGAIDICLGADIVLSLIPAILPLGFVLGRRVYNQFFNTPSHTETVSQDDEFVRQEEDATADYHQQLTEAKEENEELVGVIDDLRDQINGLEERLGQEIKEKDATIEKMTMERETTKRAVLAQFNELEIYINTRVKELNMEKNAAMEELDLEKEENTYLQAKLKKLSAEKDDAVNELRKAKERSIGLLVKMEDIEESSNARTKEITNINVEKNTVIKQLQKEKETNVSLQAKLKEVEELKSVQVKEIIESKNAELQKEEEINDSLQVKLVEAEKLESTRISEMMNLTSRYEELKEISEKVKTDLYDAQEKIKSLEEKLEMSSYEAVNPIFQVEEFCDLYKQIHLLQSQCSQSDQALQEIKEKYSSEKLSFESQFHALESENKLLVEQVKMSSISEAQESLLKANADLQKAADQALEEVHHLKDKCLSAENKIDCLQKLLTESEQREKNLNAEVSEMKETIDEMELELAGLKKQIEMTQSEVIIQKKLKNELEQRELEANTELERLKMVYSGDSIASNTAESFIMKTESIKEELSKALSKHQELEDMAETYKQEMEQLSIQLKESQSHCNKRLSDVTEARKMLIDVKKSEMQLKSLYSNEKSHHGETKEELVEMKMKCQLMESQLVRHEVEMKAKSTECNCIKENQSRLHGYIERLLKVVLENHPTLLEKVK